ncbi:MAG: prepilin-type N-terminal cleavage/methylation domain-containing protein [Planctomycetes bacterium]|nr:prepilin-type N-terminal cleavage/methylation domain-containing protein [Planctomycetota bacterium]
MRRGQRGFTLIEILIAMVLLMIGIVGILSLFPVAIKNVQSSVEDSAASNLAQSLYGSMTEAMRRPVAKDVTVTHDGLPGGRLTFTLPSSTGSVTLYPAPGAGTDPTLEVYQLGTDSRTMAQVNDIRQSPPSGWSRGGDPTEPTTQYSFQFEVSRPPESVIVVDTAHTTTDLPLYQFRFVIYHGYYSAAVPGGQTHPAQVKEFTTFIAGTGL